MSFSWLSTIQISSYLLALTSSLLSLYVYIEQYHRTLLMNSACRQISAHDIVQRHHWSSAVRVCQPSTRVERSAAARNVCTLSVYISQTSEDSSLPALLHLTVCVVPEQWLLSFSNTLIVRVTYLFATQFIMVALCNRADHNIFMLFLLLSFSFSSPNLSGRRLDVYHTLAHGVALVRI